MCVLCRFHFVSRGCWTTDYQIHERWGAFVDLTVYRLFFLLLLLCYYNSDASRPAVHQALVEGDRIGLIPGGIPEIFEGYPKPLTHPDDEFTIVPRGFLKMALQHQIPVVPVFCFGATKLSPKVWQKQNTYSNQPETSFFS